MYIYIHNTITHPLQPLKKNASPGHPWNSSGPNASDAKALWRAPFPQPGEHSRHKPWLDQMDRTWRGVIPGVPNEPYDLPWNQWNQWNNGLIFWALFKGCGAYRRRFEKEFVSRFSSACRLVLCPNTNTNNPLLPDPRSRKKLKKWRKKVSTHMKKCWTKAIYIHHIDMPTSTYTEIPFLACVVHIDT